MIDFTKIQTTPVPPHISFLQKSNMHLSDENEVLKAILTGVLIVTGICALNEIIEFSMKNEVKTKNNNASKK